MRGFESIESDMVRFVRKREQVTMDRLLDLGLRLALRHQRALALIGALWFALGCAASAGFVDLPRIPFVTDRLGWLVAGMWNALWWGLAYPRIAARREQRRAMETNNG